MTRRYLLDTGPAQDFLFHRRGVQGRIDIQIAAVALSLGNCTVVTGDSDLEAVPGLTVENWASP